jgi:hypothetical protein
LAAEEQQGPPAPPTFTVSGSIGGLNAPNGPAASPNSNGGGASRGGYGQVTAFNITDVDSLALDQVSAAPVPQRAFNGGNAAQFLNGSYILTLTKYGDDSALCAALNQAMRCNETVEVDIYSV